MILKNINYIEHKNFGVFQTKGWYGPREYSKNPEFVIKPTTDEYVTRRFLQNPTIPNLTNSPDWTAIKKVHFSPYSDYPKSKLKSYSNIARCLKADKADAIVIPSTNISFVCNSKIVFTSREKDEAYMVGDGAIQIEEMEGVLTSEKIKNKQYREVVRMYLKHLEIIPEDAVLLEEKAFGLINEVLQEHLDLLNSELPVITESTLETMLSNNLEPITQELLEDFDGFLSSNDSNTVSLGLDMLSSHDIINSACQVTALLLKNGVKIKQAKRFNSVNFKCIMKTLHLTEGSFGNFDDHKIYQILDKAVSISLSEEDREKGRKLVTNFAIKRLLAEAKLIMNNYPSINLDLKKLTEAPDENLEEIKVLR